MATNADIVKAAASMGITGYDKKTASATGTGTTGQAKSVNSGSGGADKTKSVKSAAVGAAVNAASGGTQQQSGLVSDKSVASTNAAQTINNMTDNQRASLSRQLGRLGYTLASDGSATKNTQQAAQNMTQNAIVGKAAASGSNSGKNYNSSGNYTGPVNNYMRTAEVDDTAKSTVSGMDAGQYANLQKQLAQLGVTLGGGSTPSWDTSTKKTTTKFETGSPVETQDVNLNRYDHYDQTAHAKMLKEALEAALAQQNAQIDYATRQEVEDLNRSVTDANQQYQSQRDAVALNEAQALDNSALYSELRGDRGGIGQAQYNSIQNTAAQNKQLIRQAQTQMASDAAQQIADLRAQGEFEKADAMLESTQSYLQQLMQLEQYALEYNLNVDQLNNALAQWESEWALQNRRNAIEDARYTEETEYNRNQTEISRAAQLAQSLLQSGIPLTDAQRQALGISKEQETTLSNLYALQAAQEAAAAAAKSASKSSGGSSGGSSRKSSSGSSSSGSGSGSLTATPGTSAWYAELYDMYGDEAANVLSANYKALGLTAKPSDSLVDSLQSWIDKNGGSGMTSFGYDEDEGTITWNGQHYNTLQQFMNAVNEYDLSPKTAAALEKKLQLHGFNVAFE